MRNLKKYWKNYHNLWKGIMPSRKYFIEKQFEGHRHLSPVRIGCGVCNKQIVNARGKANDKLQEGFHPSPVLSEREVCGNRRFNARAVSTAAMLRA